jgi:hypothetical protein
MNLAAIIVNLLVLAGLVYLGFKLAGWANQPNRDATEAGLLRKGRWVSWGVAGIWVVLLLGYYQVITVPAALRGPVAGNELPSSTVRETPRTVAPPAPIAPLQPDTGQAAEDNRRLLQQMPRQ